MSLASDCRLSSNASVSFVFDDLNEFGRIVGVLQQAKMRVAEHLKERRRGRASATQAAPNPRPVA